MLNSPDSQRLQIQRHLAKGRRITPLEALEKFGCMRLGARIRELKVERFPIDSEFVEVGDGKRVKSYWFRKPKGKKS